MGFLTCECTTLHFFPPPLLFGGRVWAPGGGVWVLASKHLPLPPLLGVGAGVSPLLLTPGSAPRGRLAAPGGADVGVCGVREGRGGGGAPPPNLNHQKKLNKTKKPTNKHQ